MHRLTNIGWPKFSPLPIKGAGRRSGENLEEDGLCSTSKGSVNEEYLEAFRTKSFIDISNKAQIQQRKTISATSSLPDLFIHLTDYLLEPQQETVTKITQTFNVHRLLVDYFQASLEACQYCDKILETIHELRVSHHKLTRLMKLAKRVLDADDQSQNHIFEDLAMFATSQNNPLANVMSSVQSRDMHERYTGLWRGLKSKRRRIRRRIRCKIFFQKIGGIGLVVSHSALVMAVLILAFHSIVGIVAAPGIVSGLVCFFKKKFKWARTNSLEALWEQLDVAAKGVYILINDFDTLSRMVKRLYNEVEHWKAIADVCIKNIERYEMLKQVVKQYQDRESTFLDQLKELEQHIFLCFLTINRSRTLVIQQILEKQP
ncbi:UPF0496 protein [Senna tora]|uniref:UPF0496 protein n=1 Tax=Senna tora TaxID=362788 RepID=A0A834TYC8_9FABA|nr:UPF0496 protein [Senna tora]